MKTQEQRITQATGRDPDRNDSCPCGSLGIVLPV
jgi:uncharacterized protein YecA (UPF0149 family)